MSTGALELDQIIERVRALGKLPEEVAKAARPRIEEVSQATAAAGTTPDGKAWEPRKKDGRRALANAAAAVTVRAIGPVIRLALQGTSTGSAKVQAIQNTRRPILPATGEAIPARLLEVLKATAAEVFTSLTGGR